MRPPILGERRIGGTKGRSCYERRSSTRENIFLFQQRIIVIIEIATSSKISSLRMIYRLKGIKWQEIDARFWNNCSFLLRKRKRG